MAQSYEALVLQVEVHRQRLLLEADNERLARQLKPEQRPATVAPARTAGASASMLARAGSAGARVLARVRRVLGQAPSPSPSRFEADC